MSRNDILVTGGTGKTGRRVVEGLRAIGLSPRIGTRSAKQRHEIMFDWWDVGTFDAAFKGIDAIYLVAPAGSAHPASIMKTGIDRALELNVRRFVLLSASSLEEGGPMMGEVHAYLHQVAAEWIVLRPAWFMQNFSEMQHLPTIRDESAIYSATGTGKIGFIDAADIAAVAVKCLTDAAMPSGELVLTGPATESYDDIATRLTAVTGRQITHFALSQSEMAQKFQDLGLPKSYATLLSEMDAAIARGSENQVTDCVRKVTGHAPNSFANFASDHRAVWMPV
jgi:ergot alkaloid biosynthesis protein